MLFNAEAFQELGHILVTSKWETVSQQVGGFASRRSRINQNRKRTGESRSPLGVVDATGSPLVRKAKGFTVDHRLRR